MREKIDFKTIWILFAFTFVLAISALAKDKEPGVLVIQGEIMDSQCGLNVHSTSRSHDSMTEKGTFGHDARSCTLHCAKEMAGVFVLVTKKDVYRLDDQDQAEVFAGHKVKVSATLDAKTHALHILRMEDDQ